MYTRASSIDDAVTAPGEVRAGGTDLQERLRSGIAGGDLVDIQALPDLGRIEFHDRGVTLGALVTVANAGRHPRLQQEYPAFTRPAQTLATPQIRSMATLGGVLCQRTRCWYYRHPELGCPKKGNAESCSARAGNHHFGVCFDFGLCVQPHPSSIGCALLTYDAEIEVASPNRASSNRGSSNRAGRGRMTVAELYGDGTDGTRDHLLEPGELITHVHLPPAAAGERAAYHRQMSRAWAEWPLVEVVVRLILDGDTVQDARVAIGGVANIPFRLTEVESALAGQPASEDSFAAAAELSIRRAKPLPQTGYKLDMVVGGVLQALESAAADGGGRIEFAV